MEARGGCIVDLPSPLAPLPELGEGSFVSYFGEFTLITEGKLELIVISGLRK